MEKMRSLQQLKNLTAPSRTPEEEKRGDGDHAVVCRSKNSELVVRGALKTEETQNGMVPYFLWNEGMLDLRGFNVSFEKLY